MALRIFDTFGKTTFANGILSHGTGLSIIFVQVPAELVTSFADFIEFSDDLDVSLFKQLLRRMQVQQARLRSLVEELKRPNYATAASWIEEIILDTATIYAGAVAAFDYARGDREDLPKGVMWDGVRSALNNMGLWQHAMPTLHAIIDRREKSSAGPK